MGVSLKKLGCRLKNRFVQKFVRPVRKIKFVFYFTTHHFILSSKIKLGYLVIASRILASGVVSFRLRSVAQMVARHVWDVEAPGSSPGTPTQIFAGMVQW